MLRSRMEDRGSKMAGGLQSAVLGARSSVANRKAREKLEARNSNLETNSNDQNYSAVLDFVDSRFGICFGFRASDFEF